MKFLLKNQISYRVNTEDEVSKLRETLSNLDYGELKSFSYKLKPIKEKGQVIEEYYLVTAMISINDEKDPEMGAIDIKYTI